MTEPVIHWFRRDLRLADNVALEAAYRSGDPVLPVFVLDDELLARDISTERLRFLRAALEDLDEQLRTRGSGLLVRRGDAARELNHVAEESGSWGVYFNRDLTPYGRQRDTRATRGLQMTGVVTQTFDDLLLVSPQLMLDADGMPAANFDDFSRSWLERLDLDPGRASADDGRLFPLAEAPASIEGWAESLVTGGQTPPPAATPASARQGLDRLLGNLDRYPGGKAGAAAGPLWSALRYGTISVREVAGAAIAIAAADDASRQGAEAFILDLAHREHAFHLLHAFPGVLRAAGPEGEYVRSWLGSNRLT